MIKKIEEFFYSFKNNIPEAKDFVLNFETEIKEYSKALKNDDLFKQYEDNFLTILGYTYRLDNPKDRVFFTLQEAVYAIDLDKLMRNEDSLKLNCIVYTFVIEFLIDDYLEKQIDKNIKQQAIEKYSQIEESRAKENKYHVYQY